MNATTYRQGCGTHLGLLLHQAGNEPPCGECLQGELLRRVSAEEWPSKARRRLGPVSREQAARNMAVLMAAMTDRPDDADSSLPVPGPPDPEEAPRVEDQLP